MCPLQARLLWFFDLMQFLVCLPVYIMIDALEVFTGLFVKKDEHM